MASKPDNDQVRRIFRRLRHSPAARGLTEDELWQHAVLFFQNTPGAMPPKPPDSPLGAFLAALREEKIPCILIGAMAAIQQGAPLSTLDFDFWVRLRERQYVRILKIVQRLHGTIRAQTFYELSDGTQVNVIFNPTGLRSFAREFKASRVSDL